MSIRNSDVLLQTQACLIDPLAGRSQTSTQVEMLGLMEATGLKYSTRLTVYI